MGKILYKNGDIYIGKIYNFKKHGSGTLTMPRNNRKYVGQFSNGYVTGWGILYENDQKLLEGEWEKGTFMKQEE